MPVRTRIDVYGGPRPYTLIVEAWADEFLINPRDECRVVIVHPESTGALAVEWHESFLILFAQSGDETYEFWRNNLMEFSNPVPVPGPLGEFARYHSAHQVQDET